MNAHPQHRSTSDTAQEAGIVSASALLTVSAELHTGDRAHRWNLARPAATGDPGFLGRAFRHLDNAAVL